MKKRKTHYYFRSVSAWESKDGKVNKFVVWFKIGGRLTGRLSFQFFDNRDEAMAFVNTLEE
jgi:hypothetical protein